MNLSFLLPNRERRFLLTVNFGKKGKKSGGKGLVRIIFVCVLLLGTTTGTKIGALWLGAWRRYL